MEKGQGKRTDTLQTDNVFTRKEYIEREAAKREELIKTLRLRAAIWEKMYDEDSVLKQAADAIEELANKLCDWCGVCPKERRRPWDCEIMWPNAPIPEVYIEPPKEE